MGTPDSPGDSAGLGEHGEGAVNERRPGFASLTFLLGFAAGTFVGVALALLAFVMVDEQEPAARATASMEPDLPASAALEATPDARPRTKTALDVHLGPGNGYAVVGLLAKGDAVEVVGRDNDSTWLAIRFPPGSAARGWIPVDGVDNPPELLRLAVALPTPLPRTIASSPSFSSNGDGSTDARVLVTPTPRLAASPTSPPGLPDLVVTAVRVASDRRVSVTVANRGPGDLVGFTVFVQVRDLTGRSEMMNAPVPAFRAGATLTLETTVFRIAGEQTIQAIVDPFGTVPEADRSNNSTQVVLAAPVTPTPAGN